MEQKIVNPFKKFLNNIILGVVLLLAVFGAMPVLSQLNKTDEIHASKEIEIKIKTATLLQTIASSINSGSTIYQSANLKLMNNITYTGEPIGTANNPFKGTFDGDGYTITWEWNPTYSGSVYNADDDKANYIKLYNYGLFGVAEDATIKNLDFSASINLDMGLWCTSGISSNELEDVGVDSTEQNAGALLGHGKNVTISNITFSAGMEVVSEEKFASGTSYENRGMLVGKLSGNENKLTNIELYRGSRFDLDLWNFSGAGNILSAGVLVGRAENTTIENFNIYLSQFRLTNCISDADTIYLGGVCGYAGSNVKITNGTIEHFSPMGFDGDNTDGSSDTYTKRDGFYYPYIAFQLGGFVGGGSATFIGCNFVAKLAENNTYGFDLYFSDWESNWYIGLFSAGDFGYGEHNYIPDNTLITIVVKNNDEDIVSNVVGLSKPGDGAYEYSKQSLGESGWVYTWWFDDAPDEPSVDPITIYTPRTLHAYSYSLFMYDPVTTQIGDITYTLQLQNETPNNGYRYKYTISTSETFADLGYKTTWSLSKDALDTIILTNITLTDSSNYKINTHYFDYTESSYSCEAFKAGTEKIEKYLSTDSDFSNKETYYAHYCETFKFAEYNRSGDSGKYVEGNDTYYRFLQKNGNWIWLNTFPTPNDISYTYTNAAGGETTTNISAYQPNGQPVYTSRQYLIDENEPISYETVPEYYQYTELSAIYNYPVLYAVYNIKTQNKYTLTYHNKDNPKKSIDTEITNTINGSTTTIALSNELEDYHEVFNENEDYSFVGWRIKGKIEKKINYESNNSYDNYFVNKNTGTSLNLPTASGTINLYPEFVKKNGDNITVPAVIPNNGWYEVDSPEHLIYVSYLVNNKNAEYGDIKIKLTGNINMAGYTGFVPIGFMSSVPFKGAFDGQGYTISNLNIEGRNWISLLHGEIVTNNNNQNTDILSMSDSRIILKYLGLFGYISSTSNVFGNVNLIDFKITDYNKGGVDAHVSTATDRSFYIGAFAGFSYSQINKVLVQGEFDLIDENYSYEATYRKSYDGYLNTPYRSCNIYIAGVVGVANSNISECVSKISSDYVNGNQKAAGIVSTIGSNKTISNCFDLSNESDNLYGINGYTENSTRTISDCYSLNNFVGKTNDYDEFTYNNCLANASNYGPASTAVANFYYRLDTTIWTKDSRINGFYPYLKNVGTIPVNFVLEGERYMSYGAKTMNDMIEEQTDTKSYFILDAYTYDSQLKTPFTTLKGYDFKGYSTEENAQSDNPNIINNNTTAQNAGVFTNKNGTYYLVFSPVELKVQYVDPNGNNIKSSTETTNFGANFTITEQQSPETGKYVTGYKVYYKESGVKQYFVDSGVTTDSNSALIYQDRSSFILSRYGDDETIYIEVQLENISYKLEFYNEKDELLTDSNYTLDNLTYNQNITIPNFEKQGYTFSGWKDRAGNTLNVGEMKLPALEEKYAVVEEQSESKTYVLKLYPILEAKSYTIYYKNNEEDGGEILAEQQVKFGEEITLLSNLGNKVGYKAEKYALENTTTEYSPGDKITYTYPYNIALFVQYERDTYTTTITAINGNSLVDAKEYFTIEYFVLDTKDTHETTDDVVGAISTVSETTDNKYEISTLYNNKLNIALNTTFGVRINRIVVNGSEEFNFDDYSDLNTYHEALNILSNLEHIVSEPSEINIFVEKLEETTLVEDSGVYQIGSANDLYTFANLINSGKNLNAVLTNNIDITGYKIYLNTFSGTLDGNNYSINGLTSFDKENASFVKTNNGTIKNLNFNNVNINLPKLTATYVGVIGNSNNTIKNVKVIDGKLTAKVTADCGSVYIGMLAGNTTGTVTDCYVSSNINIINEATNTAVINLGGAFGLVDSAEIDGCEISGTIYVDKLTKVRVGALSGFVSSNGFTTIKNILNKISLEDSSNVGIIAGYAVASDTSNLTVLNVVDLQNSATLFGNIDEDTISTTYYKNVQKCYQPTSTDYATLINEIKSHNSDSKFTVAYNYASNLTTATVVLNANSQIINVSANLNENTISTDIVAKINGVGSSHNINFNVHKELNNKLGFKSVDEQSSEDLIFTLKINEDKTEYFELEDGIKIESKKVESSKTAKVENVEFNYTAKNIEYVFAINVGDVEFNEEIEKGFKILVNGINREITFDNSINSKVYVLDFGTIRYNDEVTFNINLSASVKLSETLGLTKGGAPVAGSKGAKEFSLLLKSIDVTNESGSLKLPNIIAHLEQDAIILTFDLNKNNLLETEETNINFNSNFSVKNAKEEELVTIDGDKLSYLVEANKTDSKYYFPNISSFEDFISYANNGTRYIFKGFYLDENNNNKIDGNETLYYNEELIKQQENFTEEITLKAIWEAVEYSVQVNLYAKDEEVRKAYDTTRYYANNSGFTVKTENERIYAEKVITFGENIEALPSISRSKYQSSYVFNGYKLGNEYISSGTFNSGDTILDGYLVLNENYTKLANNFVVEIDPSFSEVIYTTNFNLTEEDSNANNKYAPYLNEVGTKVVTLKLTIGDILTGSYVLPVGYKANHNFGGYERKDSTKQYIRYEAKDSNEEVIYSFNEDMTMFTGKTNQQDISVDSFYYTLNENHLVTNYNKGINEDITKNNDGTYTYDYENDFTAIFEIHKIEVKVYNIDNKTNVKLEYSVEDGTKAESVEVNGKEYEVNYEFNDELKDGIQVKVMSFTLPYDTTNFSLPTLKYLDSNYEFNGYARKAGEEYVTYTTDYTFTNYTEEIYLQAKYRVIYLLNGGNLTQYRQLEELEEGKLYEYLSYGEKITLPSSVQAIKENFDLVKFVVNRLDYAIGSEVEIIEPTTIDFIFIETELTITLEVPEKYVVLGAKLPDTFSANKVVRYTKISNKKAEVIIHKGTITTQELSNILPTLNITRYKFMGYEFTKEGLILENATATAKFEQYIYKINIVDSGETTEFTTKHYGEAITESYTPKSTGKTAFYSLNQYELEEIDLPVSMPALEEIYPLNTKTTDGITYTLTIYVIYSPELSFDLNLTNVIETEQGYITFNQNKLNEINSQEELAVVTGSVLNYIIKPKYENGTNVYLLPEINGVINYEYNGKHYTFKGFEDNNGVKYYDENLTIVKTTYDSNLKLKAIWEAVEYTVQVNLFGTDAQEEARKAYDTTRYFSNYTGYELKEETYQGTTRKYLEKTIKFGEKIGRLPEISREKHQTSYNLEGYTLTTRKEVTQNETFDREYTTQYLSSEDILILEPKITEKEHTIVFTLSEEDKDSNNKYAPYLNILGTKEVTINLTIGEILTGSYILPVGYKSNHDFIGFSLDEVNVNLLWDKENTEYLSYDKELLIEDDLQANFTAIFEIHKIEVKVYNIDNKTNVKLEYSVEDGTKVESVEVNGKEYEVNYEFNDELKDGIQVKVMSFTLPYDTTNFSLPILKYLDSNYEFNGYARKSGEEYVTYTTGYTFTNSTEEIYLQAKYRVIYSLNGGTLTDYTGLMKVNNTEDDYGFYVDYEETITLPSKDSVTLANYELSHYMIGSERFEAQNLVQIQEPTTIEFVYNKSVVIITLKIDESVVGAAFPRTFNANGIVYEYKSDTEALVTIYMGELTIEELNNSLPEFSVAGYRFDGYDFTNLGTNSNEKIISTSGNVLALFTQYEYKINVVDKLSTKVFVTKKYNEEITQTYTPDIQTGAVFIGLSFEENSFVEFSIPRLMLLLNEEYSEYNITYEYDANGKITAYVLNVHAFYGLYLTFNLNNENLLETLQKFNTNFEKEKVKIEGNKLIYLVTNEDNSVIYQLPDLQTLTSNNLQNFIKYENNGRHYTFKGFYKDENNNNILDGSETLYYNEELTPQVLTISEELELKAIWEAVEYTVQVNLFGTDTQEEARKAYDTTREFTNSAGYIVKTENEKVYAEKVIAFGENIGTLPSISRSKYQSSYVFNGYKLGNEYISSGTFNVMDEVLTNYAILNENYTNVANNFVVEIDPNFSEVIYTINFKPYSQKDKYETYLLKEGVKQTSNVIMELTIGDILTDNFIMPTAAKQHHDFIGYEEELTKAKIEWNKDTGKFVFENKDILVGNLNKAANENIKKENNNYYYTESTTFVAIFDVYDIIVKVYNIDNKTNVKLEYSVEDGTKVESVEVNGKEYEVNYEFNDELKDGIQVKVMSFTLPYDTTNFSLPILKYLDSNYEFNGYARKSGEEYVTYTTGYTFTNSTEEIYLQAKYKVSVENGNLDNSFYKPYNERLTLNYTDLGISKLEGLDLLYYEVNGERKETGDTIYIVKPTEIETVYKKTQIKISLEIPEEYSNFVEFPEEFSLNTKILSYTKIDALKAEVEIYYGTLKLSELNAVLPNLTMEGYTFNGYTFENNSEIGYVINQDTATANFIKNIYRINIEDEGTSSVFVEKELGEDILETYSPTEKENLTYIGLSLSKTNFIEFKLPSKMVKLDEEYAGYTVSFSGNICTLTVYPIYIGEMKVTLTGHPNSDIGNGYNAGITISLNAEELKNDAYQFPVPTVQNDLRFSEFKGYYNGETKIIDENGHKTSNFVIRESIILTQKFEPKAIEFVINANENTTSVNNQGFTKQGNKYVRQIVFGEEIGLLPILTLDGYNFKGYYFSSNADTLLTNQDICIADENGNLLPEYKTLTSDKYFNDLSLKEIYAKFEYEIITITVITSDINLGKIVESNIVDITGLGIEKTIVEYENGQAKTWQIKAPKGSVIELTATIETLRATFKQYVNAESKTILSTNSIYQLEALTDIKIELEFNLIEFNITYIVNGNVVTDDGEGNALVQTYTYQTETFSLIEYKQSGYNFGGWYKEESLNTKVDKIEKYSTGDITLNGKLTEKSLKANIYSNIDGYVNVVKTIDITYNLMLENLTIDVPNGHYLIGCFTEQEKRGIKVSNNSLCIFTEDINLYAYFEEIPNVTLNGNGSELTPFEISNEEEFKYFAYLINANILNEAAIYYEITNNIELKEKVYINEFKANINGNGYVVYLNNKLESFNELTKTGKVERNIGLFKVNNGRISNIILSLNQTEFNDLNLVDSFNVGVVASKNNGTIENTVVYYNIEIITDKELQFNGISNVENAGKNENCSEYNSKITINGQIYEYHNILDVHNHSKNTVEPELKNGAYLIRTNEELAYALSISHSNEIKLLQDIDMKSKILEKVNFAVEITGNGYTISNLIVLNQENLFTEISIKETGLENIVFVNLFNLETSLIETSNKIEKSYIKLSIENAKQIVNKNSGSIKDSYFISTINVINTNNSEIQNIFTTSNGLIINNLGSVENAESFSLTEANLNTLVDSYISKASENIWFKDEFNIMGNGVLPAIYSVGNYTYQIEYEIDIVKFEINQETTTVKYNYKNNKFVAKQPGVLGFTVELLNEEYNQKLDILVDEVSQTNLGNLPSYIYVSNQNTTSHNLKVVTEINEYTVVYKVNNVTTNTEEGGYIEIDGNKYTNSSFTVDALTKTTATAVANEGYRFIGWSDEKIESTREDKITQSHLEYPNFEFIANFERVKTYSLTLDEITNIEIKESDKDLWTKTENTFTIEILESENIDNYLKNITLTKGDYTFVEFTISNKEDENKNILEYEYEITATFVANYIMVELDYDIREIDFIEIVPILGNEVSIYDSSLNVVEEDDFGYKILSGYNVIIKVTPEGSYLKRIYTLNSMSQETDLVQDYTSYVNSDSPFDVTTSFTEDVTLYVEMQVIDISTKFELDENVILNLSQQFILDENNIVTTQKGTILLFMLEFTEGYTLEKIELFNTLGELIENAEITNENDIYRYLANENAIVKIHSKLKAFTVEISYTEGGTITVENANAVVENDRILIKDLTYGEILNIHVNPDLNYIISNIKINKEDALIDQLISLNLKENVSIEIEFNKVKTWLDLNGNDPQYFELKTFTGNGTESDPYLIKTRDDILTIAYNVNILGNTYQNKYFKSVKKDLKLSFAFNNLYFVPIGTESVNFEGIILGNNLTLEDIKITGGSNVGLFRTIGEKAIIKSINVTGSITGNSLIGGICGTNNGTILGVSNNIRITSQSKLNSDNNIVGSVSGINNGTISQSYNEATILSSSVFVGGIAGVNNGEVLNVYNKGQIVSTYKYETSYVYAGIVAKNNGRLEFGYNASSIFYSGYEENLNLKIYGTSLNTENGTSSNVYYNNNYIENAQDTEQGRPYAELTDKTNLIYEAWDFETVWYFKENFITYPELIKLYEYTADVTFSVEFSEGFKEEEKILIIDIEDENKTISYTLLLTSKRNSVTLKELPAGKYKIMLASLLGNKIDIEEKQELELKEGVNNPSISIVISKAQNSGYHASVVI